MISEFMHILQLRYRNNENNIIPLLFAVDLICLHYQTILYPAGSFTGIPRFPMISPVF